MQSRPSEFSQESLCLMRGRYRFAIGAPFGNRIAAPEHYVVALDGVRITGRSVFCTEEQM